MVAISLYRGNLHRVADVPRQWMMPRRSISLKEFRSLLRRRSKALSLLTSTTQSTVTTTIPPPPPPPPPPPLPPPPVLPQPPSPPPPPVRPEENLKQREENPNSSSEDPSKIENRGGKDANSEDRKEGEGGDCVAENLKKSVLLGDAEAKVEKEKEMGSDVAGQHRKGGKAEDSQVEVKGEEEEEGKKNRDESNYRGEAGDVKEKRQKEIVEELEILNKKKHNLVQLLKQILNAEEELKRRSNTQAPPRPSLPLQVDVSNDSGSLTGQPTPRLGSDANVTDVKGEADDSSNPSSQPHQLLRMSSTSPSAESALRRPPHFQHQVLHPSRASSFAAGSPSRFAPLGNQSSAHPPNLQTVSASGMSYVASSPSPAASGGTSSFRDACHPSPWN